MATVVQSSINIQEQSLFHHELIKILVRHQLSLKGENWDEFLTRNDLAKNEIWPPLRTRVRCKRNKSSVLENSVVETNMIEDEVRVWNLVPVPSSGNKLIEDKCVPKALTSHPERVHGSPLKKLDELANVCYTETKLKQNPNSEVTRRFTLSMATVSMPKTLQ